MTHEAEGPAQIRMTRDRRHLQHTPTSTLALAGGVDGGPQARINRFVVGSNAFLMFLPGSAPGTVVIGLVSRFIFACLVEPEGLGSPGLRPAAALEQPVRLEPWPPQDPGAPALWTLLGNRQKAQGELAKAGSALSPLRARPRLARCPWPSISA